MTLIEFLEKNKKKYKKLQKMLYYDIMEKELGKKAMRKCMSR